MSEGVNTKGCSIGLDRLCWHNFENNRLLKRMRNYARIIDKNLGKKEEE